VPISESQLLATYAALEKPLYNVLFRLLWQAHDCQDIMHDAYLRIWAKRASLESAQLNALVYATALNLAKNKLRWRALWSFVGKSTATTNGDDPIASQKLAAASEQTDGSFHYTDAQWRIALARLDSNERNLVLLSECAGLSTQELAEFFQLPEGTVASKKHRALAKLRVILEEPIHVE
jgi:RNA polymerase sigma-70 factor, ECF subfamily